MDEQTARREIVRVGQLMYERSYVVSSDGNVSVRLDDGRVLATPTMTCKGRMTEDSLAITDMQGRPLSDRKASSELAMHLLIYEERADVKAVCHAHPPHGTAFAVAGLAIDQPILSEVILTLGCVPLAEYGTPSTAELTEAMRPLVKHHNALLMANHGAVAYGADIWQAFDRLETLEHTARIAILSRLLGGSKNLPADAIEKLINVREAAGYLNESARCQACGYLHETRLTCPTGERNVVDNHAKASVNGAGKIALTREELVELLCQAAQVKSKRRFGQHLVLLHNSRGVCMSGRLINQAEIEIARQVFEDQLPYDRIHLANYFLPYNNVPVTLASVSSLIPIRSLRSYTIYFGPKVFGEGADASVNRSTFIHELTHVWQGQHSLFAWEYMIKSMIAQGHAILVTGDRNNAYTYKPGKSWGDYNVEQQASIVADWFEGGMKTTDERFTFIVNNIRAGQN